MFSEVTCKLFDSLSPEYFYYEFHPYWTVGIPSASNGHIVYIEYYHIRISTARSFLVTEEKEDHFIDINLSSAFHVLPTWI